uniref:Uncharacterized protein n=1 Tax=Glossina austeni TaxID=7395 RepID=A0A1A9VJ95_GLOAU
MCMCFGVGADNLTDILLKGSKNARADEWLLSVRNANQEHFIDFPKRRYSEWNGPNGMLWLSSLTVNGSGLLCNEHKNKNLNISALNLTDYCIYFYYYMVSDKVLLCDMIVTTSATTTTATTTATTTTLIRKHLYLNLLKIRKLNLI